MKKIIDLTLDLTQAFKKFRQFGKMEGGVSPADLGHIGTHIDIMDSPPLDIQRFISRAHLIDVSNAINLEIDINDTTLPKLDIRPGDSVIFRTDWLNKTYLQEPVTTYFEKHPYLSWDLINLLLEKEVNLIGIDAPGIRQGLEHPEVDMYCAAANIFIIENLTDLDKLTTNVPFDFYCFPAKLTDSTGITCRAIAMQQGPL